MTAPEQRAAWPLSITIDGPHPPSPNARLHALTRFRLMRLLATAIYWQARARATAAVSAHRRRGHVHLIRRCGRCARLHRAGVVIDNAPGHVQVQVHQVVGERRRLVLEITPLDEAPPRAGEDGNTAGACIMPMGNSVDLALGEISIVTLMPT